MFYDLKIDNVFMVLEDRGEREDDAIILHRVAQGSEDEMKVLADKLNDE